VVASDIQFPDGSTQKADDRLREGGITMIIWYISIILWTMATVAIARYKGYNLIVAVPAGAVLGLIAVFIYACLPSKRKKKQAKEEKDGQDTRIQ
jgi:CHASE2 domain-containing sensor protein